MKKRALISVSDKTGVVDFCKGLEKFGFEIISTGGTLKALVDSGVKAVSISDITGFPECLDGRVKTLHPNVHAGLLAMRSNREHMEQLEKLGINTIDIVCVNLYPFKETISKPNVEFSDAVENIDIGGPTMLRSAAKNYQDVVVVIDPRDYIGVLSEFERLGNVSIETKKMLMYKVFQHTAVYDTMISTYLSRQLGIVYPEQLTLAFETVQDMRYGENPHQGAVFYKELFEIPGSLPACKQLHGKELSYNNINDTNGALDILREFSEPCVVAVKHSNPCGVAIGKDIFEAYQKAYDADPVSIFGGIVATNCEVTESVAKEMSMVFLEVIIAPAFTKEALAVLMQKQNLRLLELKSINAPLPTTVKEMKKVVGGLLAQDYNTSLYNKQDLITVTFAKASEKQQKDLEFAMKVVKHTKSNAIVLARDGMTVGIGGGQTNRIWACKQAIEHAEGKLDGAVVASDAFFPFSDCVDVIEKAGIKAIIQPGGSIRDKDSIDACNKAGIAMMFTSKRHFKH